MVGGCSCKIATVLLEKLECVHVIHQIKEYFSPSTDVFNSENNYGSRQV